MIHEKNTRQDLLAKLPTSDSNELALYHESCKTPSLPSVEECAAFVSAETMAPASLDFTSKDELGSDLHYRIKAEQTSEPVKDGKGSICADFTIQTQLIERNGAALESEIPTQIYDLEICYPLPEKSISTPMMKRDP